MLREADFSPCRTWRYSLDRIWNPRKEPLVVIGLNPSTADEVQDDPTVRRCMGYARDWGHGGLVMLNLFAFRSTDPTMLGNVIDPIGPKNNIALEQCTIGRTVLCAWGNYGSFMKRGHYVLNMLKNRRLLHLGLTKSGEPKHPLYLKASLKPVEFEK